MGLVKELLQIFLHWNLEEALHDLEQPGTFITMNPSIMALRTGLCRRYRGSLVR